MALVDWAGVVLLLLESGPQPARIAETAKPKINRGNFIKNLTLGFQKIQVAPGKKKPGKTTARREFCDEAVLRCVRAARRRRRRTVCARVLRVTARALVAATQNRAYCKAQ
jgi:hypothetical protein